MLLCIARELWRRRKRATKTKNKGLAPVRYRTLGLLNTIDGSRCTLQRIELTVVAFLAGCATYRARPIDPTVHAREFSERRLDSAGVAAFAGQNGAKEWQVLRLRYD